MTKQKKIKNVINNIISVILASLSIIILFTSLINLAIYFLDKAKIQTTYAQIGGYTFIAIIIIVITYLIVLFLVGLILELFGFKNIIKRLFNLKKR